MNGLSSDELCGFLLGLGVLIGSARALGELARRCRQPAILGEILAGIVLGPTLLGGLLPQVSSFLFPKSGGVPIAMDGLTTFAIVMFLLVTGMKVDLSMVWRQGRSAMTVSICGMLIPFALGFAAAWFTPSLLGAYRSDQPFVLALFFGTALGISALPVVAKILMDLKLHRSDVGVIILTAAVFDDLAGWLVFGVIVAMVQGTAHSWADIGRTIGLALGLAAGLLTVGRWLIGRLLSWVREHASLPGVPLSLALTLGLLCAACTEWIGLHAIFGAFLLGTALGNTPHLRRRTRRTMHEFICYGIAPLFFASIGLRVDFVAHFDWVTVVVVLLVATFGKVLGCSAAARWAGLGARESWAIGFGLNARGAMDIILGLLALRAGIIHEQLFVAIVIMALVTSMTSGTLIQSILRPERRVRTDSLPGPETSSEPVDLDGLSAQIIELAQTIRDSQVAEPPHVDRRLEKTTRE